VLEVPFVVPAGLPAEDLGVKSLVLGNGRVHLGEPDWARGDPPLAHLRLPAAEAGASVRYALFGTILPPAGSRVETLGPTVVPPGAHLRFALALEPNRCADHPLTEIGIDVRAARRTWPVYRRRLDPQRSCGRWLDEELSLGAFAGRRVRIRLRARAHDPSERARRLFLLWGDPMLVSSRAARPARPNVILISLDTLGARHVGSYGYPHPTTPRLDALAREGVLFERALSHYPSTAASHMTLFTALLPAAHGVRGLLDELPPDVPTLPELLRRAGYLTAAVTENATLARGMGFVRGFHVYWEHRRHAGSTVGMARETFARARRWLRKAPLEPFFLFIHTYEVHTPYQPRPHYRREVRSPGHDEGARDPALPYDAEVRFADHLVGRLVALLRRRGVLERTLLVVTSDHGEAFGEHGGFTHGTLLYDEVMHVPLVLRGPGVRRGVRVATGVGLADVLPTILELAGEPPPAALHGRSLRAALDGHGLPPRPLVAEVRGRIGGATAAAPNLRAVWLGDRKVIHDAATDRWQVYDLASDPGEQHDLGATAPEALAEARGVLAWYEGLAVTGGERGPATALPPVEADSAEKLRALGYVE
jgi:arylsulfatase A-like enzyme